MFCFRYENKFKFLRLKRFLSFELDFISDVGGGCEFWVYGDLYYRVLLEGGMGNRNFGGG